MHSHHGNADCERGFSENKHAVENQSSLSITSISSLRQTKTYMKRYSEDPTKVPLTKELLRAVENSYRRYRQRIDKEEASRSLKRRHDEGEVSETKKLTDEKSGLKCRLPSLKALLLSAQELISKGVAVKDMDKVGSGRLLLSDVNSKLPKVLERIEEIDSALQTVKKR